MSVEVNCSGLSKWERGCAGRKILFLRSLVVIGKIRRNRGFDNYFWVVGFSFLESLVLILDNLVI